MSLPLSPGVTSQVPALGGGGALGHTTMPAVVAVQSFSQPSPGVLLPSSQASVPSFRPLPQTTSPGVGVQSAWQPSPSVVLPSSHSSLPVLLPSPQMSPVAGVTLQSFSQ